MIQGQPALMVRSICDWARVIALNQHLEDPSRLSFTVISQDLPRFGQQSNETRQDPPLSALHQIKGRSPCSLYQAAHPEILLDNDIYNGQPVSQTARQSKGKTSTRLGCPRQTGEGSWGRTVDGGHDESNLGRVGCTSEVSINLFCFMLIQRDKSVENVVARSSVIRATCNEDKIH